MKIVSDIDECVVEYLQGFCDFYNDEVGGDLVVEHWDFKNFSFQKTLGISAVESDKIREEYMMSKYFDNMKFIDGAREGIEKLASKHDLVFVTNRPGNHKVKTRMCYDYNFPNRNFDIYFEDGCKLDRIVKLGADLIIEDSPSSLKYAEEGFRVLLFDRKWNRDVEHENIYRCENWGKIISVVDGFDNV